MINLLRYFSPPKNHCLLAYERGIPAVWTSCKYNALSEEGFSKNVFAYRAINLISKGIASIPLSATCNHKIDAEVEQLISNPSTTHSKNSFIESIVNYLMISGNAYVYWSSDNELQVLRPDRMKIVPNEKHNAVSHYIYSVNSKNYHIERDAILHIKMFNPLNDWYGVGPLQIAMQAIDQYNEMSKHNIAILQNGGRPSGCFIIDKSVVLTDEELKELQKNVREVYAGSNQAGKILFLHGGLEWREMSMSPRDMDFESGRNLAIREIAQAFGIPSILLGMENDASFNSYKEARLNFWEDTIIPLAEHIRDEFSKWLSKHFGRNIQLHFDWDSVHALIPKREALWNKISSADFLTIDEKRQILGYPTMENKSCKTNITKNQTAVKNCQNKMA